MKINRALISVSDKKGIVPFAKVLNKMGVEILSTGGTAKALRKANIKVKDVSSYTKFPEIMNGRVKSLHPKIHGGILAMRDNKTHLSQAKKHGIEFIDLVVVNLYPFGKVVNQKGAKEAEIIENIDIGGPSMLRSAAKNHKYVVTVCDPDDYDYIAKQLKESGKVPLDRRRYLAAKVFNHTYKYDQLIANYLFNKSTAEEMLDLHYEKVMSLRYGENPHQKAAFFRNPRNKFPNVTNAKVLQGKQLSFNNILDTDAALELVKEFQEPTAVFIKHTNPCGVATAKNIDKAFDLAYNVDSLSAFGCVIALNRDCTKEIAEYIKKNKMFVEIIVCPKFTKGALEVLSKRKNLRLLESGKLRKNLHKKDIRKVAGGLLVQEADLSDIKEKDLKVVSKRKPTKSEMKALVFARKVVKHVKSNAVVFAKEDLLTGVGAGQMSRVDSVYIASKKSGKRAVGSVMASDAFFPFPDAVQEAKKAGITSILQPGGSIRDEEVIKEVDKLGMSMVFTGVRTFKH